MYNSVQVFKKNYISCDNFSVLLSVTPLVDKNEENAEVGNDNDNIMMTMNNNNCCTGIEGVYELKEEKTPNWMTNDYIFHGK